MTHGLPRVMICVLPAASMTMGVAHDAGTGRLRPTKPAAGALQEISFDPAARVSP